MTIITKTLVSRFTKELDAVNETQEKRQGTGTTQNKFDRSLSSVLDRFSFHLDNITRSKNITANGERFLRQVKVVPPFLGLDRSIIEPEYERNLAEHFLAKEFVEKNRNIIRVGGYYQVKPDQETFRKVAEDIYGNAKYAIEITAKNPGAEPPSTGQTIILPYIDISDSLGLSPEQIERKYALAQDQWIELTLKILINQFSLIEDEALKLMKWSYDAAQRVRNEERISKLSKKITSSPSAIEKRIPVYNASPAVFIENNDKKDWKHCRIVVDGFDDKKTRERFCWSEILATGEINYECDCLHGEKIFFTLESIINQNALKKYLERA